MKGRAELTAATAALASLPPVSGGGQVEHEGISRLVESFKENGENFFGIEYFKVTKFGFLRPQKVRLARGPEARRGEAIYGGDGKDEEEENDKTGSDNSVSGVVIESLGDDTDILKREISAVSLNT